jgi:quercetin dioxygenase-like cupin family protein
MEIPVYDWSQVRKEQLNPEVARQVIHGEKMTVARFFLKRGAVVPEHSHDNEEITVLEQGRVRLFISGEEQLAVAGQVTEIPPNAPHKVVALEDSVAMDLFAPVREDWIRGDDAYLRG